MIINLRAYSGEVAAYVAAAKGFIDRTTWSRLQAIQADLEFGKDNSDEFPWFTKNPIQTNVATRYDRLGTTKAPVVVTMSFDARFRRTKPKSLDFEVLGMVTHIKVFSTANPQTPALHVHIDKKNSGQLGPGMHMQVSEAFTKQASAFALAVPRLPTGFLLPTDCLDFVLAEFFPDDWAKAQVGVHQIESLRNAQLERARQLGAQLEALWKGKRGRTPLSVVQGLDCSYSGLRLA